MKTVHQESMSALCVLCASAVKKSRSMPTDPEDMSIRMPYVHLAHVPRHVRRRPGHLEALFRAMSVHGIHVVHPDRHPHSPVCRVVAVAAEGHGKGASSAASLSVVAEKDLAIAGADATEFRRLAPVPRSLPSQLLEPREAVLHARDVENRSQAPGVHGILTEPAVDR